MNYSKEELERASRPLLEGEEPVSYRAYHYASLDAGDIDPSNEMLRYLCARFELNLEQRHWLAFLYATCYCGPTAFYIYNEFPDFQTFNLGRAKRWWAENRAKLVFQTDRQWLRSRNQWCDVVESYRSRIGASQAAAFERLRDADPHGNYRRAFMEFGNVEQFGRFAMFLFLDAVNVTTGWPMKPDTLDMRDADSCRDGLAFAIGRADLSRHEEDTKPPAEQMEFLQAEFDRLAVEMQAEDQRNTIWKIETTLCAYKKYRLGKRTVGYYLERQRKEIEKMQGAVTDGVAWRVLWDYRRESYAHEWLTELRPVEPAKKIETAAPLKVAAPGRLRVVAIGGEPATGKTTLFRKLLTPGTAFKRGLLRGTHDEERDVFYLGLYDGELFDGTDRLSMAVQPDAEQFVEEMKNTEAVIVFEGDRLFRRAFLEYCRQRADLTAIMLAASGDAKVARHTERGDDQSETFLKTQASKLLNISRMMPVVRLRHETEADTVRVLDLIRRAMNGEAIAGDLEEQIETPVYCSHDEIWPLEKFQPNPQNPNTHPAEQIKRLAHVLLSNGWRMPITVSRRSGMITKGHGRLEGARAAGLATAPMEWQDYATEAEERRDMIADNRLFELGETDEQALAKALTSLQAQDADAVTAAAYEDDELQRIFGRLGTGLTPTSAKRDADPAVAPVAGRRTIILHYTEAEHVQVTELLRVAQKRTKAATATDAVRLVLNEDEQ